MIYIILILLAFCPTHLKEQSPPIDQIKVVIFDFGKVVVQKNCNPLAHFLAQELEISNEEGLKILDEREEALLNCESERLFFKKVFHNLGKEVPLEFPNRFKKELEKCIVLDKQVMRIIELLKKQNKKIILFSNTAKHKADHYKELGYYAPFDLLILSYEIGLKKPQEQAYNFVEMQAGFLPHEALFIDDKIENVRTARKIGWNALLFENADQLGRDLEELGFFLDTIP